MDITGCNDAQKRVIGTLPGPLFVAAGAGSGKTFTLKLRTANAFLDNESGFKLDSIEQVLAITFTEKAAEELLSRIKDTLFKEGLIEQAQKADSAWISTIHGFCSRFLRENALEIGLDPEFRMISEREAAKIGSKARDHVLERVRTGRLKLPDVDWNWSLLEYSRYGNGLVNDAEALLEQASCVPDGIDALKSHDYVMQTGKAVSDLANLGVALLEAVSKWGRKPYHYERTRIEALPDAIHQARVWLEGDQASLSSRDERFDRQRFLDMMRSFPALTATFGKKTSSLDIIDAYRRARTFALYEVVAAFGMEAVEATRIIAQELGAESCRLKREAGVVDNDDLITLTLEALRTHEHLAARYRDRFRLIMVDEFQDTNKAQIEIVRALADPGMANVCVVGDAQQSIYRFRGADVRSFTEYRDALAQMHPDLTEEQLQPKLADNFRSHADILAFVDAVFGQEMSFGQEYLKLAPCGKINDVPDPVMDDQPRVTVDVTHYLSGDQGRRASRGLREGALRIAQHFAQIKQRMKEEGVQGRQTFALLLGRTKNAQVYIDALRAHGLESMMTSGSILMRTAEAKMLDALLRHAVNTQDEQPLLECLTSPLFSVSDDALLALSHRIVEGEVRSCSIAQGFASLGSADALFEFDLSPESAEGLRSAKEALDRFVKRARTGRLSHAVRQATVESGWLDRAQAQGVRGLASVGNLAKLTGMLEEVERDVSGFDARIEAFHAKATRAKESPGVLSVAEADFVQIMTVHGSKGLQFDHVAVAELKNGLDKTDAFLVESEGVDLYAMSSKGLTLDSLGISPDELGLLSDAPSLSAAATPGQLRKALEERDRSEKLAEARRLLYVAFTRAVRSLYVCYLTDTAASPKDRVPYASDGVMREVHEALRWETNLKRMVDQESCRYGGSRAAKVVFQSLNGKDDHEEEPWPSSGSEDGHGSFTIVVREAFKMPHQVPFVSGREDLRSYTSLSSAEGGAPPALPDAIESGDSADGAADAAILEREADADATALGTAFHRLAQLAIIHRAATGTAHLEAPSESAMRAQEERLGLSPSQSERLRRALDGWFSSAAARELCQGDSLDAEVPFMVRIDRPDGSPVFLEGEIDALSSAGEAAFLADYKTGGHPSEDVQGLMEKHRLQAECYAYALLRNGFSSVKATFVRVEQRTSDGAVQTVPYAFTDADLPRLEADILARWKP